MCARSALTWQWLHIPPNTNWERRANNERANNVSEKRLLLGFFMIKIFLLVACYLATERYVILKGSGEPHHVLWGNRIFALSKMERRIQHLFAAIALWVLLLCGEVVRAEEAADAHDYPRLSHTESKALFRRDFDILETRQCRCNTPYPPTNLSNHHTRYLP